MQRQPPEFCTDNSLLKKVNSRMQIIICVYHLGLFIFLLLLFFLTLPLTSESQGALLQFKYTIFKIGANGNKFVLQSYSASFSLRRKEDKFKNKKKNSIGRSKGGSRQPFCLPVVNCGGVRIPCRSPPLGSAELFVQLQ